MTIKKEGLCEQSLADIEQFLKILDQDAQYFHFQVFDESGKSKNACYLTTGLWSN